MEDDIVFKYDYVNRDFFGYVLIEIHKDGDVEVSDSDGDTLVLSKDCAIAAARAILKYFGESVSPTGKEKW